MKLKFPKDIPKYNQSIKRNKPNYPIGVVSNYLGIYEPNIIKWVKAKDNIICKYKKPLIYIDMDLGSDVNNSDDVDNDYPDVIHNQISMQYILDLNNVKLSFYNLVEVYILNSIFKAYDDIITLHTNDKLTIKRMWKMIRYIEQKDNSDRPLLKSFLVDEIRSYLHKKEKKERHIKLILDRLDECMSRIHRDKDDIPDKLYLGNKFGDDNLVCIDPKVFYGHPVVSTKHIWVYHIVDTFLGGASIQKIADDHKIDEKYVLAAIKFEISAE